MKAVAIILSMISLTGCVAEEGPDGEETVLEVGYFGGCAWVSHCPRYVVHANGAVEAQLVMPAGVETTKTTSIEASLVRAALAEFATQDLDALAQRFRVGCQSIVDGVDARLTLPTEATSMACIHLSGIANEIPAFAELVGAMVEALDDEAGFLGQINRVRGPGGVGDS